MMHLFVLFERKPSMYPDFATFRRHVVKKIVYRRTEDEACNEKQVEHDGSTWNFILVNEVGKFVNQWLEEDGIADKNHRERGRGRGESRSLCRNLLHSLTRNSYIRFGRISFYVNYLLRFARNARPHCLRVQFVLYVRAKRSCVCFSLQF